VMWTDRGQVSRFEKVLWALDPQPGERLLDYGCGTGALTERLSGEVGYLGYDWAEGMVERAKRVHPGREFTTHHPINGFDLVACVGPFNLKHNWSKQHTWHTLRHLWATTGCHTLAALLYTGEDLDCISYTLEECKAFAHGESYWSDVEQWRYNDILILLKR